VGILVKRFSEAVSSHIVSVHMLETEVAVFDAVLDVVVVYINVLCTLV
jgi:hypothetical protein